MSGTEEAARRFFSGETEAQAVLEAAAALGVAPAELAYERKQGSLRRGRVVIVVDTARPRREAAGAPSGVDGGRMSQPPARRREGAPGAPHGSGAGPRGAEESSPQGAPLEAFVPASGVAGAGTAVAALGSLAGLELEASAAFVGGEDGDELRVDLRGRDAAALTADDGELLQAAEYLLRRMVRDLPPGGLSADSDGFRAARLEGLRRRAAFAAESVRRTGEAVLFEPLPAAERRIVHLVIQEEAGVASGSEGEGELRRVRVSRVERPPA